MTAKHDRQSVDEDSTMRKAPERAARETGAGSGLAGRMCDTPSERL